MKNNHARSPLFRSLTAVATITLLAGCMTLEQMAPPVGVEFQQVAQRRNVDVSTLELGRQVYLMDCARCHSVAPIGRYSESRWRKILPRMGKDTKLDADEQAALDAYVMTARAFLSEQPAELVSAVSSKTD